MKINVYEMPPEIKEDVNKAVAILKKAGCSEIYIFGSIARGEYNRNSDIDFVVKGLPKKLFFKISGRLMNAIKHRFDLVEIDDDNKFSKFLLENEVFIRVA